MLHCLDTTFNNDPFTEPMDLPLSRAFENGVSHTMTFLNSRRPCRVLALIGQPTLTAVFARDLSCCVTQSVDGCEVAHLCPKAELERLP